MPVSFATSSSSGYAMRYCLYQFSHSLMAIQTSGMGSTMWAASALRFPRRQSHRGSKLLDVSSVDYGGLLLSILPRQSFSQFLGTSGLRSQCPLAPTSALVFGCRASSCVGCQPVVGALKLVAAFPGPGCDSWFLLLALSDLPAASPGRWLRCAPRHRANLLRPTSQLVPDAESPSLCHVGPSFGSVPCTARKPGIPTAGALCLVLHFWRNAVAARHEPHTHNVTISLPKPRSISSVEPPPAPAVALPAHC